MRVISKRCPSPVMASSSRWQRLVTIGCNRPPWPPTATNPCLLWRLALYIAAICLSFLLVIERLFLLGEDFDAAVGHQPDERHHHTARSCRGLVE